MPSPARKSKTEIKPIPPHGYVRIGQILAVIPICKSSWYEGIKALKYPAPVTPSPFGRISCWRAEDIWALLDKAGERSP